MFVRLLFALLVHVLHRPAVRGVLLCTLLIQAYSDNYTTGGRIYYLFLLSFSSWYCVLFALVSFLLFCCIASFFECDDGFVHLCLV